MTCAHVCLWLLTAYMHVSIYRKAHVLFTEQTEWGCILYLLTATVRASGEPAHGHMTSDFKPILWNTFRNASQEDIDPYKMNIELKCMQRVISKTHSLGSECLRHTYKGSNRQRSAAFSVNSCWCQSDLCGPSKPNVDPCFLHMPP